MGNLSIVVALALALAQANSCLGFQLSRETRLPTSISASLSDNDDNCSENNNVPESSNSELSRRDACRSVIGTAVTISSGLVTGANPALAVKEDENGFAPAIRPTAYRVDSTIPPTLLPLSSARKEKSTLGELGKGFGTDKQEIKIDTVNLNNFMNKLVFGSIDLVSQAVSPTKDESKIGPGYASFVCMGMPSVTTSIDVDLASSLMNSMLQDRDNKLATALGLSFCPMSVQPALDAYAKSGNESVLRSAMTESGVSTETVDLYMPLIRTAKGKSMDFLAMSPEYEDIKAARSTGLGSVDFNRRQSYVLDPEGFISITKDPRYKLYTDRSLLKDVESSSGESGNANIKGFFAERIFVHETGASLVAKYAVDKPESLVVMVAPISDVRYLQGINGRIPRVYGSLVKQNNANGTNSQALTNKVSDDAVTTILVNPTALDTLSVGRKLRLEIGTGPDTLQYQTKIADYIWFSASPKVSLIPRMMN
mmetsp:Transcript_22117/g.61522  ORF Transcript_22117/g.61522 Transcript_22117/m.61522 type:complete len:482 (-) Transcript_22117:58-1503(-)|eukprot:CAMPEP_0172361460 /NCGR_PEP_ID=MMETSP1060-20121228/5275_1 /TAXON_ID=37318 /ORGANISM="Pseudo-nitzschia pungens, Strain cf. cingulata" /LENGTH=481 /DNA_ID=CAMNT_0013083711 /DNA_START=85 /DNA_END=1530 /DNA_ORIENTATION=+